MQGAPAPSAPPLPAAVMAEQRAPVSWEALPVAYPAIYRPGQGQGEHAGGQAQVRAAQCQTLDIAWWHARPPTSARAGPGPARERPGACARCALPSPRP